MCEKHQSFASYTPPTGDLVCNPGTCSGQDSNRQPFGSQISSQSSEPHWPGLNVFVFFFFLFLERGMMGYSRRKRECERERKTDIDLLFHLFMYSLVGCCMCPDPGLNSQPWHIGKTFLTNWGTWPGPLWLIWFRSLNSLKYEETHGPVFQELLHIFLYGIYFLLSNGK